METGVKAILSMKRAFRLKRLLRTAEEIKGLVIEEGVDNGIHRGDSLFAVIIAKD
jgi:hypothetical protein